MFGATVLFSFKRQILIFIILTSVATVIKAQVDLNTTGYLRAGAASTLDNSCLTLPGARSKFRLGNECNHYGELALQLATQTDNNIKVEALVMGSLYLPYNTSFEDASTDTPQYYVEVENVINEGVFREAKFWLGKRYYRRHDVHILDFFYWANNGIGFGVQDIKLGDNKVAYAYKTNINDSNIEIQSHDIQLYDIDFYGQLSFGIELQHQDTQTNRSGMQLHAQYKLPLENEAFFEATLQYGEGSGANLNMSGGSGETYRLTSQLLAKLTESTYLMPVLVYENQVNKQEWLSFGFRAVNYLQNGYSLAAELGHNEVSPVSSQTRTLDNLTLALQWSAKKSFWDRPVFRLYSSLTSWNNSAAQAGVTTSSNPVFINQISAFTTGVQIETWW